jgi:hypothetical protein
MSSDFSDFLGQDFMRAMLPIMCIITLMLIATIAAIVYVRRRKAQQTLAQATASGSIPLAPSFVTGNMYASSDHDMPDLNLLVHNPPTASAPVTPPPAPAAAPAPIRSARKGTFTVVPKDGGSTEAVEVMTILRDVVDGKLIIQMGEKTYENINTDPEFKERFNKLMREVGQMVGKVTAAPSTPVEAALPSPMAESENDPIEFPSVGDLMQASEPTFLAPKKPTAPPVAAGKLPGDLPSFKLDDNPMQKLKRGQKASEIAPVPEINIAGAIEAYLQHKLSITPEYAGHSIHIYPAPGGGVSIEVDGQYFEAVSDVSDPSVREFLSDTIAEWQDRH